MKTLKTPLMLAVIAIFLASGCSKSNTSPNGGNDPPPDTTHQKSDTVRIIIKTDTSSVTNYCFTSIIALVGQHSGGALFPPAEHQLSLGTSTITYTGTTASRLKTDTMSVIVELYVDGYPKLNGPPSVNLILSPKFIQKRMTGNELTCYFKIYPNL